MTKKDFREIPGHAGCFVSKDGVVISTAWGKERVLSQWINSNGYLSCKAANKALPIHRAVALAWLPNDTGATDVNHKDGNKLNNAHHNLEWCSRRENLKHALRTGLHALTETPIVATHVETGRKLMFKNQASVRAAGFSQPNVNKCLKGLRRAHKSYTWEYDAPPPG